MMIGEKASRIGETYLNGIGLTTLAVIHDCRAMLRKLESDRVMLLNNEDCFKETLELYERTVIFINELDVSSGHIGDVYEGFFHKFKEEAELLKENLEKEMEERFVIKRKGE